MDRYRIRKFIGTNHYDNTRFESWCMDRVNERNHGWALSLMGLTNHDYLRANKLNGAIVVNPRLDTKSGRPEFHEMAKLLSYELEKEGR